MRVSMFERTRHAGLGLAWDGALASHCQLSNLPVGMLRLSDAFRPTFQRWLQETYPDEFGRDLSLEAAYPPRPYFGEYVSSMCNQLRRAPHTHIETGVEALRLEKQASGFRVVLRRLTEPNEGETVDEEADCVILCAGAAKTGGGAKLSHLSGAPGYIESPWPAVGLADALRGATGVAVIGAGLTAVDVVKQFDALGLDVPVLMTSRQARFNVVARDLGRLPPYECEVLTPEVVAALPNRCSLEQCVELLKWEIEMSMGGTGVDWQGLLQTPQDGIAELRRHVAAHYARPLRPWQHALAAIEDVFPHLWRRLSDSDRARWFASDMKTVFQNYTNPMPVASAESILTLVDSGRLTVCGGLAAIEPLAHGSFRLHYNGKRRTQQTIDVSHCVDCTGVGFDSTQDRSPLMRQLLRDGLARPHRFGGLHLDPDSFRVTGDNEERSEHNLYVVGDGAKGVRYLTSGIGFIRAMITGVVQDIASQIESRGEGGSPQTRTSEAA